VHLADLLTALAVLGVVLAAALTLLEQGQQVYAFGAARVEVQQSARVALDRLARDIRGAGFGRGGIGFSAISVAEPGRIVLHSDLDGDGVIAARGETITWRVAGGILRRDAGGGAQPVINGVRALALTYLDAEGRVTDVPAAVRAVTVTLTTQPDHAASVLAGGVATTVTTQVRLRNR
jgi:type II secretory pathway component PulJ